MELAPAPVAALLESGNSQLAAANIEESALEARLLLQFVSGMNRSQLMLHSAETLDAAVVKKYQHLLDQRCRRIPLQHLTGSQEFWTLELIVSPAVLIPRPETEFLIEQVLATLQPHAGLQILDLCTGSGAIALVLAQELGCAVVGADLSLEALAVARENCLKYQLTERIQLVQSDLFSALAAGPRFDCIVSNPPYIVEEEIDRLQPEVAAYEPRLALSGGVSGLDCIERIIAQAPGYLQAGGWLFLEIGSDQKLAVTELFEATGLYEQIQVLNDYAGRPRVARARLTRL